MKSHSPRLVFLSSLLLMATTFAPGAIAGRTVAEAFPHRSTGGESQADRLHRQEVLQRWLLAEMPAGVAGRPIRIEVSPGEIADLERRDREDAGVSVVGLVRRVDRRIDLPVPGRTGAVAAASAGTAEARPGGGLVWAVAVTSEGASALRVGLSDLRLPSSAELYVHNGIGQAFGPYPIGRPDGSRALWSHTVMGPTAFVQVHLPAGEHRARPLGLTVSQVGHLGPRFLPAGTTATEAFCAYNSSCIQNAECFGPGDWSFLDQAQDGVAMMLWISGAFINTCSGGLLADTDPATEIPYFLTANHCISKNNNAANLETFFRYRTNCGAGCPAEWTGGGIQVLGSTVRATNRTGDFTLLELSEDPPADSTFFGWTTADVANADGTALYRVSHPATAPEAFSTHAVDTSASTCLNAPRGDWIYSEDVLGATEGGSSGSVVSNAAGQVVGQLTGSCGSTAICDVAGHSTVDGAFAAYFDEVEPFLDPPSTCTPSTEVCDGLDNDCDGSVDEDLPAPSGAPALLVEPDLLTWSDDPTATAYDVVRGDVASLAAGGGDFAGSTTACLADDQPETSLVDTDLPLPGGIWWTLVRPVNCHTSGTYGSVMRDDGIGGSLDACP